MSIIRDPSEWYESKAMAMEDETTVVNHRPDPSPTAQPGKDHFGWGSLGCYWCGRDPNCPLIAELRVMHHTLTGKSK